MPRDNQFLTGFLQGLYQSGLGNPAVNDERQKTQMEQAYKQAQLNQDAAEKGLVPANQASTAPSGNPGSLSADHPVMQKAMSSVKDIFFPTSGSIPTLQTAFKPDPNANKYSATPTGQPILQTPGQTGPAGPIPLTKEEYLKGVAAQSKTSKPTIRIALDPSNKDEPARLVGEDYVAKPGEMIQTVDTLQGLSRLSSQGLTGARKSFAQTLRDRFELSKRQAVFGGQFGKNQLSLNTALGHASSAADAFEAIQNTDVRFANTAINKLKEQGDPNIIALDESLTALKGELANVFKGSGATDQEIGQWSKSLSSDLTPTQAYAAIQKISDLLSSRMDALRSQQSRIAGGDVGNPLTPKAKKTMDRFTKKNPLLQSSNDGWSIQRVP